MGFRPCVGLVLDCASFSLGRRLSSTTSVEGCPSLFGSFIGITQRSDSCSAYVSAVRLCAFADRSVGLTDTLQVSRFSCMLFLDVRRAFDHAASRLGSRNFIARADVAFPLCKQGQHAVRQFSGLNLPARRCLYLRFAMHLAAQCARLKVGIESLLLSRRALSSPTTCRFIPAHSHPCVAVSSKRVCSVYKLLRIHKKGLQNGQQRAITTVVLVQSRWPVLK